MMRHKLSMSVRNFLSSLGFIEIETPVLIKSTPEGARDFLVPSRMNPGSFYALPQSPQQFKQLLMVGGIDKYFQIVKCFRDEELRADRQPEFTQIDCEMSFVDVEDVVSTFEGMVRYIFKEVKNIELPAIQRMDYADAMKYYGVDKPDMRFPLKFVYVTDLVKGKGFKVFEEAQCVVGFNAIGLGDVSRNKIKELTEKATSSDIGAKGLVYVKCEANGEFKSGVDKFYSQDDLKKIGAAFDAKPGDFICLFAGEVEKTRVALGRFRLYMGDLLKLRDPTKFEVLWVVNFPLLEYDEEEKKMERLSSPFHMSI